MIMKPLLIILILVGLFVGRPAFAFPSLVPEACLGDAPVNTSEGGEACDLTAVELLIGNIAQIILGLSGSLALLAFVVGGILFLVSGGEKKRIEQGQNMLKYAAIGLAMILLSGVAIKVLLKVLTGAGGS